MARRIMTVARFEDIKHLILQGQKDRAIARSLRCSRDKVAEVRRGEAPDPSRPKVISGPLWAEQISWPEVVAELSLGHLLKFMSCCYPTTVGRWWATNAKKCGFKNIHPHWQSKILGGFSLSRAKYLKWLE